MKKQYQPIQDLLLLVGYDVPNKEIAKWSEGRIAQVKKWAFAVHLRASDNIVRVPNRPLGLVKFQIKSSFNI